MTSEYEPRGGRVVVLLDRMYAEPKRIFTSKECAQIMGCANAAVSPTLLYAIKARRVFKRNTGKRCEYSATEMAGSVVLPPAKKRTKHPEKAQPLAVGWATSPDDPRIGRLVPGWMPPKMVCVRLET
jgi:hypothetical protein